MDFDHDSDKDRGYREGMMELFLSNTRSIREIRNLAPEFRPRVGMPCIDERAVVPSGVDVENAIHINTPGGGMEFLSDQDKREVIKASNNDI